MNTLVTGGTGFIGSHTIIELLENAHSVIVIDNLWNSSQSVISRVEEITKKKPIFYCGDCRDRVFVESIFEKYQIDVVIHFASYKSINESLLKPIEYYDNNINSLVNLCNVMKKYKCKKFVFSSSASVYGTPKYVPIFESFPVGKITNPYAYTKVICERILNDIYCSDNEWKIIILRYFNPIGAHPSGLVGENPNEIPNNLLPYISKVANRDLPILYIFGNDYETIDGTGVRDYIHVVDLAQGHVCAVNAIDKITGVEVYNLGTGKGTSVLSLVHAFEEANNLTIPYCIVERRQGDVAECYANTHKARIELSWEAKLTLTDMCRDAWNFILMNNTSREK